MRNFYPLAIALLLTACASSSPQHPRFGYNLSDTMTTTEYTAFLDRVQTAVAEDDPRALNESEMADYQRIDERLRATISDTEAVGSMDQDNKLKFFNLHHELLAVLMGNDENQVVCRERSTVGTHRKQTECTTRGELRRMQDGARGFLDFRQRSTMQPPSGG